MMNFLNDNMREELAKHFAKILQVMDKHEVDTLLVASNANIYYCSMRFFRGYVLLSKGKAPVWFVIRPTNVKPENDIIRIRKPEDIPAWMENNGYPSPSVFGLEKDDLTYSEICRLKKLFPDASLGDASKILREARMTKTDWELNEMRKDGIHHCAAYKRFTGVYREDMTDVEFQIELERILRIEGALGYSRTSGNLMEINLGSVINGDNADNPTPYDFSMGGAGVHPSLPVGANGTIMKPGTSVMVDMSGAFNGYQTDMTRVWRIGEVSGTAYKAHECSRHILRRLEEIGKPGVSCAELYEVAIQIAREEGLEDYFMGHRQKAPFIGHGVGIQLNEMPVLTPRSRDILQEGMTLAIEPKFVIPGVGAVGVENTYVVRSNGLENLTPYPEEMADLFR